MNKNAVIASVFLLTCLSISGIDPRITASEKVITGNYWKEQALKNILPYWTKYAQDTSYPGSFLTNLDENWNSSSDMRKYPSMIGRQIFSYSVAYLLTGSDNYLDIAEKTKKFLIEKAWDHEYGGWFDALNRDGTPFETTKNIFIQTYAATGLAMYYFVTHDPEALQYLQKTNELLESKAWDKERGGYYDVMTRDWKVKDNHKSFASQVAPVSGYLLYHYLATRDKKYLLQAQKLMRIVVDHMTDKETGWVLESFDKEWNYCPGNPDEINAGHNLEVVWMMLRLNMIDEHPGYTEIIQVLDSKLNRYGFDSISGAWRTSLSRRNAEVHGRSTYWWIQAYGNMYKLASWHQTNLKKCISDFIKGACFWDSCFLDKKNGDTYLSVDVQGKPLEKTKGNAYKAAYHNTEQCFLNYLYLNLWIHQFPLELFFKINSSSKGEFLFPIPIEDKTIRIKRGFFQDGGRQTDLEIRGQSIRLPVKRDLRIKVLL